MHSIPNASVLPPPSYDMPYLSNFRGRQKGYANVERSPCDSSAKRANIKLCFRRQRCDNIAQILVHSEQVPQRGIPMSFMGMSTLLAALSLK
jgi:hypothetical protein